MKEVDHLAKLLWDYNQMHHKPVKSDVIIALGSMDLRVAERAAELWNQRLAPLVIVSGGFGRLTSVDQTKSEASIFKSVLLGKGVPEKFILAEDQSTNTAENLVFAFKELRNINPKFSRAIIVTKPYAEKRTYATFKKLFSNYHAVMASPKISYENYPIGEITKDLMINIMVGDTQRILLYPEKGYTVAQTMPTEVKNALSELINHGYNKQLIK